MSDDKNSNKDDNDKILEELNKTTTSSATSIKNVIDKVLLRSSNNITTLSPNLKSTSKKPIKQPISDNKKDSEDLFEQPDQLETNVSSTISFLIESKKKLYNQVQIELEKSSTKKIGIINLQNQIKLIENEKEELITKIEDTENGIINKIEKTVTFDSELRNRLSSIESVIEILDFFETYNQLVIEYQENIKSSNYIQSTIIFNKMFSWFNNSNNQPFELTQLFPQPRIIPSIKDQLKKRKNQLKSILLESFTHSIIINNNEIQLSINSNSVNIYTVELIKALESLGLFNHIITSFSSNLFQTFLQPIINNIQINTTQDSKIYKEYIEDGINYFKFEHFNETTSISNLYEFLINLVKFLKINLFGNDSNMMNKFGNEIWGELSTTILEEILKPKIPEDTIQLKSFDSNIKSKTNQFEEEMFNLLELNKDDSNNKKLSEFVNSIEFHYSERKRTILLSKTREIILKDRYQSIRSDDSIFGKFEVNNGTIQAYYFDDRSILESTNLILYLCLSSLKEASESSGCLKKELYQGCRDIFDIYLSIYLKFHYSKLEKVPILACLFYNSCLFYSHCFLILSTQYGNNITEKGEQIPYTFIDFSSKFKQVGNTFFSEYIIKQLNWILSFLQNTEFSNQLENTKDQLIYSKIQNNFTNMNNELNRLSCIWKDLFPREEYFELISKFSESIISTIIKMILKLQNIELVETQRLSELVSSLYPIFIKFFIFPGESDDMHKNRMKLVKSWKKFWQVKMVLELPLSEIVTLYKKGHLSKLSNNELRLLILAIFDDFELKTNFLQQLNK